MDLLQEVHVHGYSPSRLAPLLVIRPPVESIPQEPHLEVQGNWASAQALGPLQPGSAASESGARGGDGRGSLFITSW